MNLVFRTKRFLFTLPFSLIFLIEKKNFIDFREPKNRATWLKIWYKQIEKLEKENPWALAFNEEEEIDSKTL